MKLLYVLLTSWSLATPLYAQVISNYVANEGNSTTPASHNTLVGALAGSHITTGSYNVFLGSGTGIENTTGYDNVFIGMQAGLYNNSGWGNSFVGASSGTNNTSGYQNTFMGMFAGNNNGSGRGNCSIGYAAGYMNRADYNCFVGDYAGYASQTGGGNTFLGVAAAYNNKSGYSNVVVGVRTFYNNLTGHNNVMVGDSAGYNITTSNSVFVGSKAGWQTTTGTSNTFVGYLSGQNVTTGSNNIIIGPLAGTTVSEGSDNVLMGYNSQAEDGLHNATAIGAHSRVAISNALILGNDVNVGIGTSSPATRLELVGASSDQSGLRLTKLTAQSPSTQVTDQFLTVDAKGDVVKARYQLRISHVSQWSDRVFSPTYPLRTLNQVATYIQQQGHLPGIPSAQQVQQEGVDLVKMNSLLLEKIEELTLYSIQQQAAIQALIKKQAQMEKQLRQRVGRK